MKIIMATMLVAGLLALVGCEAPVGTNTEKLINQNPVKVGDPIVGGLTVTQVDADSTGYIATRDFKLVTGAVSKLATDTYFTDPTTGQVFLMSTGYPTTKHVEQTTSAGAKSTVETVDANKYFSVFRREALIFGTWTKDVRLTNDTEWTLAGPVFIGHDNADSATITIDAGTIVKGTSSSIAPGMLVISRGSKIQADGTDLTHATVVTTSSDVGSVTVSGSIVARPIIFTSAKAVGARAPGDWGGLVINGNAPVNDGDGTGTDAGEGNSGNYGGNNADDNSGVMKFVRSEFAGVRFTADNELNGIAFQGVGRGTTIDYIQAHLSNDDGVEMFGGTANIKHLVSTGNLDDYLDWTSGWVGAVQYGVLQQYPLLGIDNGLEGDGKENNVTAMPYSNPYLANLTIIGAYDTATFKNGANLRRGTKATIINTIFTGFKTAFRETDPTGSAYADVNGSGIVFKSVLAQAGTLGKSETAGTYSGFAYPTTVAGTSFASGTNNNLFETTAPSGSSIAAGSHDFSSFLATLTSGKYSMTVVPPNLTSVIASTVTTSVNGATLDNTTFVGAVDAGTTDSSNWYYGWTTNAAN